MNEELETHLDLIEREKENFSDDGGAERTVIDAWTAKLRKPAEEEEAQSTTLQYARALAKCMEKKVLSFPFTESPPETLQLMSEENSSQKKHSSQVKKFSFEMPKMPCSRPKTQQKLGTKPKKPDRNQPSMEFSKQNEFEDAEEMALAIARSKGQTLMEFVAAISRHTKDYGQELRTAMKGETSSFRDYVDHVLSQRIKDVTEVLDEEQNRELLKIKKDTDKWQMELAHLKRRIKEMVPTFDIDLYRKDKNFLKKQFTVGTPGMPQDDSFKRWKEESVHRLKWISEMTNKLSVSQPVFTFWKQIHVNDVSNSCRWKKHCNEEITQEISDLKNESLELETREASRQQNIMRLIDCEMSDYQRLKQERDRLHKENTQLLSQLQEISQTRE